jgi:hypothetical protein
MINLNDMIANKVYNSEPSYTTYEDVVESSKIDRMNIFPYPFYFVSDPFKDDPKVYSRDAGWSSEIYIPKVNAPQEDFFKPCFQPACNTTFTNRTKCKKNNCINIYR